MVAKVVACAHAGRMSQSPEQFSQLQKQTLRTPAHMAVTNAPLIQREPGGTDSDLEEDEILSKARGAITRGRQKSTTKNGA